MDLAWVGLGGLTAVLGVYHFGFWWRERRLIEECVLSATGRSGAVTRESLARLKNWIAQRVEWRELDKSAPRSLLRAPARQIIETGQGFCGENARVAILALAALGVRANRLYLEGPEWGHVAVEHEWDGEWVLFDSHSDPATMLADENVGRIPSDRLDLFPNAHSRVNPWTRKSRIKQASYFPGLEWVGQRRPPHRLVILAESPDLVRATSFWSVSIACWIGLVLF